LTTLDERFLAGAPQKKTHEEPTRAIFGPCFLMGAAPAIHYICFYSARVP
jgi:hypothetical protein